MRSELCFGDGAKIDYMFECLFVECLSGLVRPNIYSVYVMENMFLQMAHKGLGLMGCTSMG